MITNEDILNMNFYKKEKFTGSYRGMRYLIRKASVPEEDAESGADESGEAPQRDVFSVTIWRGPYNYDTTPEEEKMTYCFPFTPEGKQQVVDWLNAQWESRRGEWETR